MNLEYLFEILPNFTGATVLTILISFGSALLGAVIGFILQAINRQENYYFNIFYRGYVWVVRGTPFLVQLFIFYYGLPVLGLKLSAIEASILSLGIYASGYFAEIFRAAWNNIPSGHHEAAISLGLTPLQSFFQIQTPQALRFSIPLITNQTLLIIKESALTSIITVPELTMRAGQIVAETFNFVEPYVILALLYWLLTFLTSLLGKYFERKFNY